MVDGRVGRRRRASFRQGSRSRTRVAAPSLSSDIIVPPTQPDPGARAPPADSRCALRRSPPRLPVRGARGGLFCHGRPLVRGPGREADREEGCPLCLEWQLRHAAGTPWAPAQSGACARDPGAISGTPHVQSSARAGQGCNARESQGVLALGGRRGGTDISAFLTVLHNEHTEPLPALRHASPRPCTHRASERISAAARAPWSVVAPSEPATPAFSLFLLPTVFPSNPQTTVALTPSCPLDHVCCSCPERDMELRASTPLERLAATRRATSCTISSSTDTLEILAFTFISPPRPRFRSNVQHQSSPETEIFALFVCI